MKLYLPNLILGSVMLFAMPMALFADIEQVDNSALEALITKGVPVVDVRRIDEWQATGVIDGAHTLTFFDKSGRYDVKKWLQALDKIAPKGTPIVLICAAGVRSKSIAELLDKRLGYSGVHNHSNGMNEWIKAGNPVVKYTQGQAAESNNADKSE